MKYWWKQDFNFCILRVTMWTTLCRNQWVWILPVGLDFVSGSGFCQWVCIASGFGYENPIGQTPCCIMWSTHNHGIKVCWYLPPEQTYQANKGLLFMYSLPKYGTQGTIQNILLRVWRLFNFHHWNLQGLAKFGYPPYIVFLKTLYVFLFEPF